ncbi:UAA transporter [Mrakia frigida]|uniref:UDP-galactose transporter HUT1 n=1 Tax=Mrakia frigida TaxID=29902 RepID=UPI003FCC228C
MSLLRLGVCCGGVYSMFLLWAVAQERLSVPFPSSNPHTPPARFKSILALQTSQALMSLLSSFIYLLFRAPKQAPSTTAEPQQESRSLSQTLGIPKDPKDRKELMKSYFKVAVLNTSAGPFGFASLRFISYPTMVLGKSCKLVPVLFMNVILYRRRFPPHKYLVVSLVTLGITLFMFLGKEGPASKHSAGGEGATTPKGQGREGLIGMGLLVVNLLIDGATNSGQDEIFRRFKVSGQQMMFFMSFFTLLISLPLILLPLPRIPILSPAPSPHSSLSHLLTFLSLHPTLLKPLLLYSFTGALGQLFIFETLEGFGSLTLVMVTVTRKLVTMVLSVVLFDHKLTSGQWFGTAVVFVGIGVEAWAKISEDREKKKAKAKLLASGSEKSNGKANGVANGNGNGKVKSS